MHYKVLLFTKFQPSKKEIATIMKPFYIESLKFDKEDNLIGEYPAFVYKDYGIGGRFDGYLELEDTFSNQAKANDIRNYNELSASIFIQDGTAYARTSWNGEMLVKDEEYEEKLNKALLENRMGFVTILDIHD